MKPWFPAAVLVVACGSSESEVAPPPPAPTISVLELPVSARFDSETPGAAHLDVTLSGIHWNGQLVAPLSNGRLADSADEIAALRTAATGAARSVTLRIYATIPYATTARIVGTLASAQVSEIAFAVRKPNANEEGYLKLGAFSVRPESDQPAAFPSTFTRSWDDFLPHWQTMVNRYSESEGRVDYVAKPDHPATGGFLELSLFARGGAVKVELQRVGDAVPVAAPAAPEMMEGVPPPPAAAAPVQAADHAAFTWRVAAATTASSPIGQVLAPLCGTTACGALIVAEGQTQTLSVLSLIGAAFPNGSPAPGILFQVPRQ